ncbi:serine hydrolase [Siphonobacter curvatus]|uniref:Serine hydrolase n=2 Tax=Siphonobacter curvatus TaxID=2094562 RepID=A0A2S7IGH5_9BACT|nr:serine hydrolase [Siphonobacter curvatus]
MQTAGVDQPLDAFFQTAPDFSGVVLIAEKGKPVYHRAFGYQNFDTRQPMTTASVFELASLSKQFTAMTILLLKEAGKLQYDDPIENYLPGLPYPGVTIRHLLNHTSGLPDYQEVMDQHWDKSKVAGNADNIAYLIQYHPERQFEPGSRYEYSNTGYMLLASIVEKVSGEDFIAFSRSRIYRPLGMKDTDIRSLPEKKAMERMAWGHLYVPEKKQYVRADSFPQFNYAIWLGNRKGPGRMSATTNDLLRWDRALYTTELVSPATLQEAFSPVRLSNDSLSNYGFGWKIQQHPHLGKVVRHSGDNPGYKNEIIRYIEADKTVIVLCNNDHEKLPQLLQLIEEELGR